ncbi:thioredoxin [Methylovirgula sp. HY1]|uniref:thioredoxin n=1 Tax=Methylovirgula sp. HY1 TaxID=2822761 RepID=UPI001C5BF234|nr:thioredoxin [Methylovirgula sp. HY1]QXX75428.1 Thioredoxin [Methylovirgula sp. HY1]
MAQQAAQDATLTGGREGGTPIIKDTETATFGVDVLTESAHQPVLVDFWAPWCEPCKQLTPVLEKVVKSAGGKVKLVKMNIDEHPQIAERLGVRSIPAIIAFQKSQPIDGFMGALPESQIRGFIERLVGPLGDGTEQLAEAEAALAKGEAASALEVFSNLLSQDPADVVALGGLIRSYVALQDMETAESLLAGIPPVIAKDPAIVAARAALENAIQAASVGDLSELAVLLLSEPDNHKARLDLAVALNALGRREEAADALLEIVKRDRGWNDDGGRKQLLQFFEAWGGMDPATITARRKLSSLLFS